MNQRESITPTYDHRKTGDRFTVQYSLNGVPLGDPKPITDPFVRGTVIVGWRDALRCLFRSRKVVVEFRVDGDSDIIEDVMELDGNYLGTHWSTRRRAFQERLQTSLSDFSEVCE